MSMRPWKRSDAPLPDPTKIGNVSEAPFASPPDPQHLFARRAERLLVLAPNHVMADYLRFLADVAAAQHEACAILPAPMPPDVQLRLKNGMPPLAVDLLHEDPAFAATLDAVLRHLTLEEAPDAARAGHRSLAGMARPEQLALAADVFAGAFPTDHMAECFFVAAALQVYLARQAAVLPVAQLKPIADGVCPACGNAPVASMQVSWIRANKTRYCCCSLCGTMWNYVRIKCTICAGTEGISYYSIEDGSPHVAVETCTGCNSYIKHLRQDGDPALDAVADDVASCGLDVMIQEAGFRRGGINPLFLG